MEKYIYPAVFHSEEVGGYSVDFPDLLGCVTEGDTLIDSYEMAQDALGIYLYALTKDGKEFPKATEPSEIKVEGKDFVTLIEWDKVAYVRKTDNKAVKKTLTIPSWLNELAEKQDVNFSQVLQEALKEELHV